LLRKIITTADGSKTIQLEEWNEVYHSKHGAIEEARHVFINAGLHHILKSFQPSLMSVLEIGFGTGLNAFLTLLETKKNHVNIDYQGVEAYPVSPEEICQLNYVDLISPENQTIFNKLHGCPWDKKVSITSYFELTKRQQFFVDINDVNQFDIIYFDAFGARVQPELWTKHIFKKMYDALKVNGVLVTYAAIGQIKRDMIDLGFFVERLDGPPGKRHMLRATKN
jgi:tRNA U34 5-methylaminomethyl-2-thiouridine-forming methyltransferase MnmC